MKVLSFIIPAYNSEAYLDKCIGSMLAPGILDKLEIIVVNDGSTDATAQLAAQYCSRYPDTVRLLSQENKGHGGALNTGCAAAKGKYLKVVDADDWVETASLASFIRFLEQCGSDVVLTHHYTVDISTGEVKKWKCFPAQFGVAQTMTSIMADWKSFDRSLTFHGITYNTDFYHRCGIRLLEHVFYEDHEYATFPCCLAQSVTPLDLFVYDYRIGDVSQSVSSVNQRKRIGHTQAVLHHMTGEYKSLPESDGKRYAAMKTHGLLMSFLTTALLVDPDKKAGRQLAAAQMAQVRTEAPEIYEMTRRKYQVFCALNRLHIGKQSWDRLLRSRLYNRLRKKRSFE